MSKIFDFHGEEKKRYKDFCKRHKHPEIEKGSISGHISITFLITSIGAMPSMKCSICGEEEDITDYNVL